MLKILIVASTILLNGCLRSLVLVKAVQVEASGNSYVKCITAVNERVSPELKTRANDLCRDVEAEFKTQPSPITK